MRKILALILSGLLILCTIPVSDVFADEISEDEPFVDVFSGKDIAVDSLKIPKIDAVAAIVIDMKSGRVLFEKNAYSRRAMASTTKIMTAIVAIENGNLDDVVTVSKRAASIWGSTIKLKAGEKLKLRELLYGLMVKSGNDAAIAVAEHIGGTVENFLTMMNSKALEIGAVNTQFRTPHGLDAAGHYTTAYDLALITKYALGNEIFSEIVGTRHTYIPGRELQNTNEMLSVYPGADGVKTGYTGQAGRCLVTSATRNNWRIISVVLNCATRNKRALSSKLILDYAFSSYRPHTLAKEGERVTTLPVIRGIRNSVPVQIMDEISMPLRQDEIDSLQTEIELSDSLSAPVYANIEVGTIKYIANGKVIARTGLKTCGDVRRKGVYDYLGEIFGRWGRLVREGIFVD